jgi:hypothetical protein
MAEEGGGGWRDRESNFLVIDNVQSFLGRNNVKYGTK